MEYKIEIVHSMPRSVQIHPEIELIYILDGEAKVVTNGKTKLLKKSDIFIINACQQHAWISGHSLLAAIIYMDGRSICNKQNRDFIFFEYDSSEVTEGMDQTLRERIQDLLYAHIVKSNRVFLEYGYFCLLADELIKNYTKTNSSADRIVDDELRIETALQYMHQNYDKKICLDEVGRLIYMSASGFSKYFKKKCGVYFSDYLNEIRLDYGARLLIEQPERLVIDIAIESGFSSASSFNKIFRKSYGMTPTEYRESRKAPESGCKPFCELTDEQQEFVEEAVKKAYFEQKSQEKRLRRNVYVNTETIPVSKSSGKLAVNVGEASELLLGQQQRHILLLKKQFGIQMVRLVNIFSYKLEFRLSCENQSLNFDLLDNILDFLVQNQIKVILDLGDNHKLIIKSNKEFIHSYEGKPFFRDINDASYVIGSLFDHLLVRYGEGILDEWIFSVTNDPRELEDDQGKSDYMDFYSMVLKLLRQKLPGAKASVYGKGLGAPLMDYVRSMAKAEYIPDYICVDALPYRREIDDCGKFYGKRSMDLDFILLELLKFKEELRQCGLGHIKIIVSEWNLFLSDRNYLNDSQIHAAQLTKVFADIFNETDILVYTYGSDLTIRHYETLAPLFGGKGLLSKDGLIKPSCYALGFAKDLKPVCLYKDKGCLVTTDGKIYSILCCNYKNYNIRLYHIDESQLIPDKLEALCENDASLDISFELKGIEDGCYAIKRYVLNKSDSILDVWLYSRGKTQTSLGKAEVIDKETVNYLNQICVPRFQKEYIEVSGRRLFQKISLEAHSIMLIQIIPSIVV